jgi:hypothetical protein
MTDHDQRFKVLLREFFKEFVQLFFPTWADRLDLTQTDWLEQEVFPDPPQGERRAVDLVARLHTRQAVPTPHDREAESWLALVHVEIEHRDSVQPLRRRMFEYYEHLRCRHRLPVLPIGLYLRVGLDGVGWDAYEEYFWEQRLVRFEYAYVGLPALDAEQYVRQDNWLGVALAVLMRTPPERRAELGQEALRRLVQCPETVYRRYLLCECVDAYLPGDDAQRQEIRFRLLSDADSGVQAMSRTLFEMLRDEGRQQGQREALLVQLEARFGSLRQDVRQRIESLPADRVKELLVAMVKGRTLQEMDLE